MENHWTNRSFFYQCWALAGRMAVIWGVFALAWTLITLIVLASLPADGGSWQ